MHANLSVSWRRAQQLGGHVEHRIPLVLPSDPDNHLPRLYDFSGFRPSRRDRARSVSLEFSKAQTVARQLHLGFGIIDPCLCGLQRFLRTIKLSFAYHSPLLKPSLPFEVVTRLGQLSLGSRQIGLRRTQAVSLVLRV